MALKFCLVTGGFGCLGHALVQCLVEKGIRVRVMEVASSEMFGRWEAEGRVEVLQADITDPSAAAKAMAGGIDTVFHCASMIGLHYFWTSGTERVVVGGTRVLLNAARDAKVPRFVFTSSHNVVFNGDPIVNGTEELPYATRFYDGYSPAKIAAEKMVRYAHGQGIATVTIRPGGVWGPRDFVTLGALMKTKASPALDVAINYNWQLDMSFNHNLAYGHYLAAVGLAQEGEGGNSKGPVGGSVYFCGESMKVFECLDEVAQKAIGASPAQVRLPRFAGWLMYYVAWFLEFIHLLVGWAVDFKRMTPLWFTPIELRKVMTDHTFSDQKARQELGYKPIYNRQQQVEMSAEWMRGEMKARREAEERWLRTPLPRPTTAPLWLVASIIIGMAIITSMSLSAEAREYGQLAKPYIGSWLVWFSTEPMIVVPITVVAWGLHVGEAVVALAFWLWKGPTGFKAQGSAYLLKLVVWFVLVFCLGAGAFQALIRDSRALYADQTKKETAPKDPSPAPSKPKRT